MQVLSKTLEAEKEEYKRNEFFQKGIKLFKSKQIMFVKVTQKMKE